MDFSFEYFPEVFTSKSLEVGQRVGCIFHSFVHHLSNDLFLQIFGLRLRNINTILDIFAFAAQNRKTFPC